MSTTETRAGVVKVPMPPSVAGVLNGLPPFRADINRDEPWEESAAPPWAIYDSEGSIVADVNGGEEMAIYFADALNALARETTLSSVTSPCQRCDSLGNIAVHEITAGLLVAETCPDCHGSGQQPTVTPAEKAGEPPTCPKCGLKASAIWCGDDFHVGGAER